MQTFAETHDLAKETQGSEARIRRLIRRGVIVPSAYTRRGTALFSPEDIAAAREKLAEEHKPS